MLGSQFGGRTMSRKALVIWRPIAKTYSSLGKWGICLGLLLALSCSSSPIQGPPGSVAGNWSLVATNAGSAAFINCSGDLLVLQGLTWAAVTSVGSGSQSLQPFVNQNGPTFELVPSTIDGISYTGGGTVTANSLRGRLDCVDSVNALSLTMLFNGAVSGNTVTLQITTVQAGGGLSGQCTVSPGFNLIVTVS